VNRTRIEKWTDWIEGPIKSNVLTMHLQRHVWEQVQEMFKDRDDLPESYWWRFMFDTYTTTQAMAVRRQADSHKDVNSLAKLIEQLCDDPEQISHDFWLGLWDKSDAWMMREAEQGWTKNFAGSLGHHLDPAIPAADLLKLNAAAASVKGYVDEHVAHSEAKAVPVKVTLTLKDVHDAIDVIGDLFQRYNNLFTAHRT
jgi:hypothetical protein